MIHLFFSFLTDHVMLYGRKFKHNKILIDFAQITLAQLHFLRQLLLFHPLVICFEKILPLKSITEVKKSQVAQQWSER